LGAERLLLVVTRNTVLAQVNLGRMRAHVVEACEQCGRLTVPELDAPMPLEAFLAEWSAARPLLFMDERASGCPIDEAIAACASPMPGPPPGILVGPEGGFAEDEAEKVRALGFVLPVSMGPRILRAETAALAALACWQAFAGDWRSAKGSG
jgi:16S rRNA (uracil1498-N3)-methyltransferase